MMIPYYKFGKKVTVDGGTCRWVDYLEKQEIDVFDGHHEECIPHLISGDMDSCQSSVLDKFKDMGSIIIRTPNQDRTDYTKALVELKLYTKKKNIELSKIYVFVESSGRFDHIMGNVNTLFKSEDLIGEIQVIQVSSTSLTWILRPGLHSIIIPKVLVQNSSWCGLLPIGTPVNCIETTGLKWNLNNSSLQFGGLVSTSNTYDDCSEVTVNTDTPVIWTMGIKPLTENINNSEVSNSDS
ncbi:thiamin pyrophosphokinase 1 isoform X2 [Ceratina calcarata]|uniref:Thiamin pyrophosphokinase 1 isoform X2 n=1 Tax=Ceratina calcarata TaxID=156304 RepID=A0AAJ7S378_9HYME|nr:thiamin pyrophosphokinase 1 isoform X2 [Ceratina calcarata]